MNFGQQSKEIAQGEAAKNMRCQNAEIALALKHFNYEIGPRW